MVPNQWPQDLKLETRELSNYEILQGRKPYQNKNLSLCDLKDLLEDPDTGHKTLMDIFLSKDDPTREILQEW